MLNISGEMTLTSSPASRKWPITVCNVVTTPLTCGDQASLTINILRHSAASASGVSSALSKGAARFRCRAPLRDNIGPEKNFPCAVIMLDQSGATFHPIAVIHVNDVAILFHFGMVDMAANDALHIGFSTPLSPITRSNSLMNCTAFLTLILR